MNKDQLKELEILDQVEYINSNLSNISLTKLCDKLEINRSTITKRFKKVGFIFDKSTNQYIKADILEANNKDLKPFENSLDINSLLKDFKLLQNKVSELEKEINLIKENSNNANVNKCITNANIQKHNLKDNIKFYKGVDTTVSYRIEHNTKELFKDFCNKHSEYKTKDILTFMINEFIDKYGN